MTKSQATVPLSDMAQESPPLWLSRLQKRFGPDFLEKAGRRLTQAVENAPFDLPQHCLSRFDVAPLATLVGLPAEIKERYDLPLLDPEDVTVRKALEEEHKLLLQRYTLPSAGEKQTHIDIRHVKPHLAAALELRTKSPEDDPGGIAHTLGSRVWNTTLRDLQKKYYGKDKNEDGNHRNENDEDEKYESDRDYYVIGAIWDAHQTVCPQRPLEPWVQKGFKAYRKKKKRLPPTEGSGLYRNTSLETKREQSRRRQAKSRDSHVGARNDLSLKLEATRDQVIASLSRSSQSGSIQIAEAQLRLIEEILQGKYPQMNTPHFKRAAEKAKNKIERELKGLRQLH